MIVQVRKSARNSVREEHARNAVARVTAWPHVFFQFRARRAFSLKNSARRSIRLRLRSTRRVEPGRAIIVDFISSFTLWRVARNPNKADSRSRKYKYFILTIVVNVFIRTRQITFFDLLIEIY